MEKIGVWLVLLLRVTVAVKEDVVSYKQYRVYSVSQKGWRIPKLQIPPGKGKLSVLSEFHEYDTHHNPYTIRSYLIPVPREKDFQRLLQDVGAEYNVTSYDLQKEIEEESAPGMGGSGVTEKYFTHQEICAFLQEITQIKNPVNDRPLAEVEPIGVSHEGREMHLVKISTDHDARKPIIFFEAGIHAREWTAISAALYTIHQLVANHTHTATCLSDIDYYIIPLSNPDGYMYSRTKNRLWRKTRSFHKGSYGVDGNRNFDFHWGESGTSDNPSSEVFRGPFPFSEPETRNVRDAGMKYKERINAFVTLHAYGPYILYPWSYKKTNPAPQADIMERIANEAARTMYRYSRTKYEVGPSSTLMYEAAGGSDDYFKGVLGVDLSFTFEISPGKKPSFVVPVGKIHGIVSEAFEGFKVIAENGARYRKENSKRRFILKKKLFRLSSVR